MRTTLVISNPVYERAKKVAREKGHGGRLMFRVEAMNP